MRDESESGWAFVAEHDGTARLLDALADLDADATYTRGDLADAAGVPVKTLYLDGVLTECTDIGLLERVDTDDGTARYRVNAESPVLQTAAAFDDAIRQARGD